MAEFVFHSPHISQRNGVSFVCERIWLARCSLRVYFLPHAWQWCGVSPVCHITWFIKCSLRVKLFLQISHRCGVSPVCLRTWFTMCSFRVNVLEQYWHLQHNSIKIFLLLSKVQQKIRKSSKKQHNSTISTIRQKVKKKKRHYQPQLYVFSSEIHKQIVYLYGVSPVWHLVWLSKCSLRAKLLPQTVQLYGLSVECLFMWRSSDGAFAKTWKQTVQVNIDPPRWHLPWRVRSPEFENALPHTWDCVCHVV